MGFPSQGRNSFRITRSASLGALLALFATSAVRADSLWTAGAGNWATPSNWSLNATPTSATDVRINNGGTASVTGTQAARAVNLGFASGDTGHLLISGTGNSLTASANFNVGRAGTGDFVLDGGGALISTSGTQLGAQLGGTGTATVSGTGTTWTNTTNFIVGASGSGTLTVSTGASISTSGTIQVAQDAGTTGAINIGSAAADPAVAAGDITANTIHGGAGAAVLNFRHTDAAYIFGSALTGSLSVNQTGPGKTILTGASTYTGPTTISAGELQIGNGGASGSLTSNVTNNAALSFNRADTSSYSGIITGAGTVLKSGFGLLKVGGASTYSGATTVSAGELRATAANVFSANSAYNLTGGALNLNGFNQTIASLASTSTSSTVALGSGTLTTGGDNTATTFDGAIVGSGSLIKNGSGTFTLSGTNIYTGATTVNSGTLQAGAIDAFSAASAVTVASGAILDLNGNDQVIASLAGAGNVTMGAGTLETGDATSTSYSGVISGSGFLVKQGSGTFTISGANTLTGITLINGGTLATAATNTMSQDSNVVINVGATLDLGGFNQKIGAFLGGGQILLGSATLTTSSADDSFYAGTISGTGGLTKSGSGTLTLAVANTYSGTTRINNGAIRADSNNNFSADSAVVIGNNGQLQLAGTNQTIASLAGAGLVKLGSGGKLTTGGDNTDTTYTGVIQGNGRLVKNGAGTFTLSGANTYTGTTTINDGAIRAGADGAFSSASAFTVGSAAQLQLGGTAQTIGSLAGSGSVRLGSGGQLTTGGDNTSTTYSGVLQGTGQLVKEGTGAFTLSGANIYNGPTTINAGTFKAGASGALSTSSAITVGSAAQLQLDGTTQTIASLAGAGGVDLGAGGQLTAGNGTDTTYSGLLQGSGQLTKKGSGDLTISGANTYSGGTTVNDGRLFTSNSAALGTGGLTLNGGGVLALSSGTNLTVDSLTWADGGRFRFALGSGSLLTVTNAITQLGTGDFRFSDSGFAMNTSYDLITYSNTGTTLGDWSANLISGIAATFSVTDNLDGTSTLSVIYAGNISGTSIDNYAVPFTPVSANFDVSGNVTAQAGFQQVNSLNFENGGTVLITDILAVNSGNFTVNNGSGTIQGGTLGVPGDMTKLGNGLLNLLGNTLVLGNVNVAQGSLAVNNTLRTNNVLVQLGAFLKGSGFIFGNVFNHGTVAPGNSPGTLTVNGNFTQSSSGTLAIEVASPQVFDRLIVTGRATLAGTLQGIAYSGYKFKLGQQIPFLQAGSISGKFDDIVMPKHYRGRFLVNGGTGSLLVAPSSYTQVADNQNQRNVAHALNSFIGKHGDRDKVSFALDLQNKGQYSQAFDQIAPGFFQTLTDIVIEQTNAQNQFLAQRISSARLGATGFTVTGLDQAAISVDRDGKSVLDAKSGKDIISQGAATKWGIWVQGNGIFAHVTNVSQVPNYHFNSGGFMVGADYTFGGDKVSVNSKGDGKKAVITSTTTQGSTLVLGIYGGYQGTYSKYDSGARTSINSALFGGYASYSNGGFYSDAIVGGSYNGYQVSRPINFSTIDRTGQSSPSGGTVTAYLDAGYDFHAGNFTFGPLLSGQYTYAGTAPFTENGADSLDLKVEQQNANSLRTNVGGQVAYTWNVTSSITLIPSARIFWQHEYLDGPRTIGASLDGGSGPGFDFETSNPSRDSVFAGVGLSANIGDRWNTSLYYNADFGRQDFISHMISASLGWKF